METFLDFLKRIFNIDNNTAATVIITLTVFILGYILTGLFRAISAFRNRRNYRKIYREMIDEIVYCTNKQSTNINNLIKTLRIENDSYFNLKKQNINLLNHFNQISFDTLYSAYFKGIENLCKIKKLKAFNKTFGLVDSLSKNENQIIIELNNCLNTFNEQAENWNDSAEKVRLNIEDLKLSLDGKRLYPQMSDFIHAIDKIECAWEQCNNRSQYHIAYTLLIRPILELYDKNTNIDIVKETKKLMDSLMDSDYYYQRMNRSLEFYRLLFSKFEYQYRHISRMLRKINIILN